MDRKLLHGPLYRGSEVHEPRPLLGLHDVLRKKRRLLAGDAKRISNGTVGLGDERRLALFGFFNRKDEFLLAALLEGEIALLLDARLLAFEIAMLGDVIALDQALEIFGTAPGDRGGLRELRHQFAGGLKLRLSLRKLRVQRSHAAAEFLDLASEQARLRRDHAGRRVFDGLQRWGGGAALDRLQERHGTSGFELRGYPLLLAALCVGRRDRRV